MRIRRGVLGWGVFLLLAGAIPLAVRAGVLTEDQVSDLWSLWPMILVGIGIGLILGRTRFEFLGGLIVAATFGLMVGGLLSGGVGGLTSSACGGASGAREFPARDGAFASGAASVEIDLACGTADITAQPGSAWRVSGTGADGRPPTIDADDHSLSVAAASATGPFDIFAPRSSWSIGIPTEATVDLHAEFDAGSVRIDLADADVGRLTLGLNAATSTLDLHAARAVRDLRIQVNAGSIGISLPNVSLTGRIEANAGSVRICAPVGAGLRLDTGGSVAASFDLHDMVQDGSTWTSPHYDQAAVRIDLRTEGNAASFTLDPEDGCNG